MRHKKLKLQEKKKKAGWVLSACGIKEVEEVLKSSKICEEIFFTALYRGIIPPHLRWREAQRARQKLCGGKGGDCYGRNRYQKGGHRSGPGAS